MSGELLRGGDQLGPQSDVFFVWLPPRGSAETDRAAESRAVRQKALQCLLEHTRVVVRNATLMASAAGGRPAALVALADVPCWDRCDERWLRTGPLAPAVCGQLVCVAFAHSCTLRGPPARAQTSDGHVRGDPAASATLSECYNLGQLLAWSHARPTEVGEAVWLHWTDDEQRLLAREAGVELPRPTPDLWSEAYQRDPAATAAWLQLLSLDVALAQMRRDGAEARWTRPEAYRRPEGTWCVAPHLELRLLRLRLLRSIADVAQWAPTRTFLPAPLVQLSLLGRRPKHGVIHGSRQLRHHRVAAAAATVVDDGGDVDLELPDAEVMPSTASFVAGDEGSGYLPVEDWWHPFHDPGAPLAYYVGVTNTVATCQTDVDLQLGFVATVCQGRIDSHRFPSVAVAIVCPRVTVVWFETRMMVIAGARTPVQATWAGLGFLDLLHRYTGRVFRLFDQRMQNWVGCAALGARLDLTRVELAYPRFTIWNRSIFAGMRFTLARPPAKRPVINLFQTGRLVITGAYTREHFIWTHRQMYYRLLPFVMDEAALAQRRADLVCSIRCVRESDIHPVGFGGPSCVYRQALERAGGSMHETE